MGALYTASLRKVWLRDKNVLGRDDRNAEVWLV